MSATYDTALEAINELFSDSSVSPEETRDLLTRLMAEIRMLVEALDAAAQQRQQAQGRG